MSIFSRFGRGKVPPLPPFIFESLGQLCWNEDAGGWLGCVAFLGGEIEIYIGSGSATKRPAEAACRIVADVSRTLETVVPAALVYMNEWARKRSEAGMSFSLTGLETYEHYIEDAACTLTFSDGVSDAVWKVNLVKGKLESCGVDD